MINLGFLKNHPGHRGPGEISENIPYEPTFVKFKNFIPALPPVIPAKEPESIQIIYMDSRLRGNDNMFYSQQTLKWNIYYEKLIHYLKKQCNLVGITIYFGKKPNDKRQEKFLQKLASFGFEVKTRDVKYIHTKDGARKMKGNLDAEMILDMVTRKDSYDTLLLFSGDSDFAVILEYLKSQKKRVLVASVKGHVSKELLNQAKYINLKQLKTELAR